MQPHINFSLLSYNHLQDSPHILSCIVHFLAPQKEFNCVFSPLRLTEIFSICVQDENLFIGDIHSDEMA
jgi:hypothetical protein